MSEALNYLEYRLKKAKNYDEAATIRKMIKQWNAKEQEHADLRAVPRDGSVAPQYEPESTMGVITFKEITDE